MTLQQIVKEFRVKTALLKIMRAALTVRPDLDGKIKRFLH